MLPVFEHFIFLGERRVVVLTASCGEDGRLTGVVEKNRKIKNRVKRRTSAAQPPSADVLEADRELRLP